MLTFRGRAIAGSGSLTGDNGFGSKVGDSGKGTSTAARIAFSLSAESAGESGTCGEPSIDFRLPIPFDAALFDMTNMEVPGAVFFAVFDAVSFGLDARFAFAGLLDIVALAVVFGARFVCVAFLSFCSALLAAGLPRTNGLIELERLDVGVGSETSCSFRLGVET
jgi:hypothetical protein